MKKKSTKKAIKRVSKKVVQKTRQETLGLTTQITQLLGVDVSQLKSELETPHHQILLVADMKAHKEAGNDEAVSMLANEMIHLHERFALVARELIGKLNLNVRLKTMVVVDN